MNRSHQWLSLVIVIVTIVRASASPPETTLPENRFLDMNDYTSTNAPNPVWVRHEGVLAIGFSNRALLAGTNHIHRSGWKFFFCRTGTAGALAGGRIIPPFTTIPPYPAVSSNLAANLRNDLNARIESPIFTNGIGTVYFEAINNLPAYTNQITVEIATNMVDVNVGTVTNTVIMQQTNNWEYVWDKLDVLSLNAATQNDFARYVKPLNVVRPVKFRIRRTGYVYEASSIDSAFAVIDNLRVSMPPASVTVTDLEAYRDADKHFIRCVVNNVSSNAPATNRVVTAYYRWPDLAPPDNGWTNATLALVSAGDGNGNGEAYEATLLPQPFGGDLEFYATCSFDGYWYASPDYTGQGYGGYPTEERSPFTSATNNQTFAPTGQWLLRVNNGTGSGCYTNGTQVAIAATSFVGMAFEQWAGDTQYVASVDSQNTVVTMPATDVDVRAVFTNLYYALTVTGGTGDGLYTNGAQVAIAANSKVGSSFMGWTGDTQYVANVYATNTTVCVPDRDIEITATFTNVDYYHVLTVAGGSGRGIYARGAQVAIAAEVFLDKAFECWTGDTVYVTDRFAANTTVTMPDRDVTLAATYFRTHPLKLYVDASRPDDSGDGSCWATAKKTLQAAVDMTVDGDTVLVTNGVCNSGTAVTPGYALQNRVVITNAILVRSVNGPKETIIEGSGMSFYSTASAVRCVYMRRGVLDGFTLQQGSTYGFAQGNLTCDLGGGGVNMYDAASDAVVTNCIIRNCTAAYGGAVYYGRYADCALTSNSSSFVGGGAYYGTLANSTLSDNKASDYGGGCYGSTLSNCAVVGNSTVRQDGVARGGGAYGGTLSRCSIISNTVQFTGGGTYGSRLDNCVLARNAASVGGGSCYGTLVNCTLSGNTASTGGGCYSVYLTNCIVYGNYSPDGTLNNFGESAFAHSCTTPLPSGAGNISSDPRFVDEWNLHLRGDSPCINSGTNGPVTALMDLSGLPRIQQDTVDMGAYEGSVLAVELPVFDPPDGTLFTNSVRVSITCATKGADIRYTLDGRDPDETDEVYVEPFVITNTTTIYARAFKTGMFSSGCHASYRPCVFFVDVSRPNDGGDGTSWKKAKRTIQAAVDLARTGDTVMVTNGCYNEGATVAPGNSWYSLKNRLVVTKTITVRSVNGPDVTVIEGSCGGLGTSSAVRGVYLSNGVLDGFTIRGGATREEGLAYSQYNSYGGGINMYNCAANTTVMNCVITNCLASLSGGGASYGILDNCRLICNFASRDGGAVAVSTLNRCSLFGNVAATYGGGASGATLSNCVVTRNAATSYGGGSYYGTLINCTLSSNAAAAGGGSYYGTLKNCIVWNNHTTDGTVNNHTNSTFYYSCTTPLPSSGVGNIDADPMLVDAADLRPRSGSPCIDTGDNGYVSYGTDIMGNPRIQNYIVDMGAHEYCFAAAPVPVPYLWLDRYPALLALSGGNYAQAAIQDFDGDGHAAWQEYVTGSDPTSGCSVLLTLISVSGGTPVIKWSPDLRPARAYSLQGKSNLSDSVWGPTNAATKFFRVRVDMQ